MFAVEPELLMTVTAPAAPAALPEPPSVKARLDCCSSMLRAYCRLTPPPAAMDCARIAAEASPAA